MTPLSGEKSEQIEPASHWPYFLADSKTLSKLKA
jgi:hypothetical protein